MSRIVLDTNSLIQSIPPKSKFHKIWKSFLDGTNELCVSSEILVEYEEILQRLTDIKTAKYVIKCHYKKSKEVGYVTFKKLQRTHKKS